MAGKRMNGNVIQGENVFSLSIGPATPAGAAESGRQRTMPQSRLVQRRSCILTAPALARRACLGSFREIPHDACATLPTDIYRLATLRLRNCPKRIIDTVPANATSRAFGKHPRQDQQSFSASSGMLWHSQSMNG